MYIRATCNGSYTVCYRKTVAQYSELSVISVYVFHVGEYVTKFEWLTTCLHASKKVTNCRSVLILGEPCHGGENWFACIDRQRE